MITKKTKYINVKTISSFVITKIKIQQCQNEFIFSTQYHPRVYLSMGFRARWGLIWLYGAVSLAIESWEGGEAESITFSWVGLSWGGWKTNRNETFSATSQQENTNYQPT